MVRLLDRLWNRYLPALYLLQEKLEHAGLTIINDEATYVEVKGEINV